MDEDATRFGRALQRWRSADRDKLRAAVLANKRKRMETPTRSFCEGFDDTLPRAFRDRQQLARRLGVPVKSLREVANLMGISKNTLHDYEIGKKYPTAEFVFDFCEVVGIRADMLIEDWVRYHPNPNVRRYASFGNFDRYIGSGRGDRLGYRTKRAMAFIARAIQFSVPFAGVKSITLEEARTLGSVAAVLMDRALLDGYGPIPDAINLVIETYYAPNCELDELGFPTY